MSDDDFGKWADAYEVMASQGTDLTVPSETLVRLFKGSYIPGLTRDHAGKKLLDVGFGNCNNLAFLGTLGVHLSGVEVDEQICASGSARMQTIGFSADLRVGTNRKIPFDSDSFDYLVSWNVLHYENSENDIIAAISEYARVLKPGGRFFLSTTGPDHKILDGAVTAGSHLYTIGRDDDFRRGQTFFYFDAPNYIHYYFDDSFRDVTVGRTHDQLMTETLDWWIVTGVK